MKRFELSNPAGFYEFKAPWKTAGHSKYCTQEAKDYLEDFEGTEFLPVRALSAEELEALEDYQRHQYAQEVIEVLAPRSVVLTDEQVEAVIAVINEAAQWVEEYNTENEDCPTADYCTWGWKESDRGEIVKRAKDRGNDEDLIAAVEALEDRGTDEDKIAELLVEASDLNYEDSYYSCREEIFSMQVGEVEEQLSDEIFHAFGFDNFSQVSLTEEQKKNIDRSVNCSVRHLLDGSDSIIVDCGYGRWYLKVDVERFMEAAGVGAAEDLEDLKAQGKATGQSIGAAQEVDYSLEEAEAEEAFLTACSEAEDNYRSYSPFEFFAKRLNEALNTEEAWEAYQEGLGEGFQAAWEEASKGRSFGGEGEDQ